MFALCLLAFALFAGDLLRHGPVTRADPLVSDWFHAHSRPVLTAMLLAITNLHSTWGVSLMALCTAAWLGVRGWASWVPVLIACVPGGPLLNALVKHAFQRARPEFSDPLLSLATYSFPSGHTAGATIWWGFMLVLLFAHRPRLHWRVAGAAFAVLMVLLTALSRVYLGVHYPSDVLAAIAEGCGWLVLCFMAVGVVRRPAAASVPMQQHG